MSAPTGLGVWSAFGLPHADAAAHVDALLAIGTSWFAPRADILARFPDLLRRCHDAGITVYPWRYVTPISAAHGDIAAFRALVDAGVDGIIIDAEVEWDQDPDAARHAAQFGEGLRNALPSDTWIADAPWPWIAGHPGYPTAAFARFCDARLPQAYQTEIGVSLDACITRMRREWGAFDAAHPELARPTMPIVATYSRVVPVVAGDVVRYVGVEPGASLYSIEAAAPDVLAMLRARTAARPQLPPAVEAWQPDQPATRLRADTEPAPPPDAMDTRPATPSALRMAAATAEIIDDSPPDTSRSAS